MNPGITVVSDLKKILNENLNEKQKVGGGRSKDFNYEKSSISTHSFSVFCPVVVSSMEFRWMVLTEKL